MRDLQRLTIAPVGDRVELGFRANAFLHQMVRAVTGTLVLVGDGKLEPADVARLLRRAIARARGTSRRRAGSRSSGSSTAGVRGRERERSGPPAVQPF